MKVKLMFPPFWVVSQPYLSIPSLISFLLSKGVEATYSDVNLDVYDRLLSSSFIGKCKERLLDMPIEKQELETLERIAIFLEKNVECYKKDFRSKNSLNFHTYKSCIYFFNACFKIIGKAYPEEDIHFNEYKSKYNPKKSDDIIKCLESNNNGTETSLVSDLLSRYIENEDLNFGLIGISVIGYNQIIPAFSLVRLIKMKNPDVKIVLGGPILSKWVNDERIEKLSSFFDYIDFIIQGEGEYALHSLIRFLNDELRIEDVPQLIYRDAKGHILKNPKGIHVDVNKLPPPVFNKVDIPRYFTPVPVLPLLSSRGCYWGKCSFCDHSFIYQNHFRKRDPNRVLSDICMLKQEYNAVHFNFHDEAVRPSEIKMISQKLNERKMDVRWSCDARLDKELNQDLLARASRSGLRVLYFGLESINKRVSSLIKKGINVLAVKDILANATKAGIWTHLFYICGFPSELPSEFKETIKFIKENVQIIGSSGCAEFSLGKHSPIASTPEKYSLKIIDNEEDLSLSHMFQNVGHNNIIQNEMKELLKQASSEAFGSFGEHSKYIFRDHWVLFEPKRFSDTFISKGIESNPWIFIDMSRDNLEIYDFERLKILTFGEDAKKILEILSGNYDTSAIFTKFEEELGRREEECVDSIILFIEILVNQGVISEDVGYQIRERFIYGR